MLSQHLRGCRNTPPLEPFGPTLPPAKKDKKEKNDKNINIAFAEDKDFPPVKLTQKEYDALPCKLKTNTREHWIAQAQRYWHTRRHKLKNVNLSILHWDRLENEKKQVVEVKKDDEWRQY